MLTAPVAFGSRPDDARARLDDASRLLREGRVGEAERVLREMLACRPRDILAMTLLGRVLLGGDRAVEAADVLDRAVATTLRVPPELLLLR
ncbi:MAG TPA: hypothetical protein VFS55_07865, partial [Dokdonella sp.]|nr:hypothetical protein [Dokdonella sp.]